MYIQSKFGSKGFELLAFPCNQFGGQVSLQCRRAHVLLDKICVMIESQFIRPWAEMYRSSIICRHCRWPCMMRRSQAPMTRSRRLPRTRVPPSRCLTRCPVSCPATCFALTVLQSISCFFMPPAVALHGSLHALHQLKLQVHFHKEPIGGGRWT